MKASDIKVGTKVRIRTGHVFSRRTVTVTANDILAKDCVAVKCLNGETDIAHVSEIDLEIDWENRNAKWDGQYRNLHFKRCPRSFLKTDVPANRPRRDCPFRSRCGDGHCILPSGLRYLWKKNGERVLLDKMICYLE